MDLLKPSGERVSFRIEFGPITPVGPDFCCCVRFHGWVESPLDIRGRDSLEAFLQAVGLVHGILHEFVQRGGRVLWPGTNNDYGLEHFVSSPEWQRAEPEAALKHHLPRKSRVQKRRNGRS